MKKGNGVFIPLDLANELPKDRPYSKIEAAYYLALENPEITINGLAFKFGWSRNKVRAYLGKTQKDRQKDTQKDRLDKPAEPKADGEGTGKRTGKRTPPKAKFKPPDWVPKEEWLAYMEVRRQIKCANTDRAMALLVGKLFEFKKKGHNLKAILETATERSWKSVYLPGTYQNGDQEGRVTPGTLKHFPLPKGMTCGSCGFIDRCKVNPKQAVCTTGIGESRFYTK